MTVINHKSISGITSITAPAGSDDLLTVHTNDTSERFRILKSGAIVTGVATASNFKTGTTNVHNVGVELAGINVLGADTPIGTGATIYDAGGAVFTGVVTATSFSGALTGTASQVTIANGADNRVITAASANTLNGEANLTYDGSKLSINDASPDATLSVGGATAFIDVGAAGGNRGKIGYNSNSLYFGTSSGSGEFIFSNNLHSNENPSHSSGVERLRISSSGDLTVKNHSAGGGIILDSRDSTSNYSLVTGNANRASADYILTGIRADWNSDSVAAIYFKTGADTTNKDDGAITFHTQTSGTNTLSERLRINSTGAVTINSGNASNNAVLILSKSDAGYAKLEFDVGTSQKAYIDLDASEDLVHYGASGVGQVFYSGTGERLRIKSDGQIVIKSYNHGQYFLDAKNSAGTSIVRFYESSSGDGRNGMIYLDTGSGTTTVKLCTNNYSYFNGGGVVVGNTAPTFNSPAPGLCIEKNDNAVGPLINLYNAANAQLNATCEIRACQNYRDANRIIFGRENNSSWSSSAAATASYIGFWTNSAGTINEKVRINSTGGLKLSNTGSGSLFEYGGSTVQSTAAINIYRLGNGYADIRLSSNYGATLRLAGASNNTDEYNITQDNQKNAYHNLEYDGFINFNTNNTTQACRMGSGKVAINKNIETLTGNGFAAALQVNNKTTDGYGTIMMGGGYNRATIGLADPYSLVITSNAYPANAATGGIKFRCGNNGGGGPTERMRIHQSGMSEWRQHGGSKTYEYRSSVTGTYNQCIILADCHNYHSFSIEVDISGYAYKYIWGKYYGYENGALYSANNPGWRDRHSQNQYITHSWVSGHKHQFLCYISSATHPQCGIKITVGGPDAYIDDGDITFAWS